VTKVRLGWDGPRGAGGGRQPLPMRLLSVTAHCGGHDMGVGAVADDLGILCNFEIALRNALAAKSEARRVLLTHTDMVPRLEIAVLDATLSNVERLVAVVAELRAALVDRAEGEGSNR
jgi:hypothetical protein